MPNREIQIQYISELKPIEVAADGMTTSTETGEVFYIKRSPRKFPLVKLPPSRLLRDSEI